MRRSVMIAGWFVAALLGVAAAVPAAEDAQSKPLSIGAWLNSPPDRPAVAFDAYFNRLYFNAEGKVVGRYNRSQKKFEAGDFRPAQWHNIASSEPASAATKNQSATSSPTADAWTPPPPYPITPYARGVPPPPAAAKAKPAEIFRRGNSAGSAARVRVIETPAP